MSLIVTKILDSYNYALENGHPWTKDWPLVYSPVPMLTIVGIWLYFCLYAGPRYMEHRKPYELKNTLLLYNFIQVCFSVYIFWEGGVNAWFTRYSWKCQPIPYDANPDPQDPDYKLAKLVWWYYFCKLTELLDTVFFILRKKNNQVTTLHLYHHAIMPFFGWIGPKYTPGGHGICLGWINSFIHIIMYTYYLLAGLGPQYQKYLWWKKHLTKLQLIQFMFIFYHNFTVLFRDCNYPRILNYLAVMEATIFIYLFGKFYYHSYTNKSKKKIE